MPEMPFVLSHWSTLIENFQSSPQEFYATVEAAIAKRKLPNVSVSRVSGREGGTFSASREYLRVTKNEFIFDICAAPFGTGYFYSSWQTLKQESGCLRLFLIWSIVGIPFLFLPRPRLTYYQMDTAQMFQKAIHNAVLEAVDTVTNAKGIRALSETERKPIMREFFGK